MNETENSENLSNLVAHVDNIFEKVTTNYEIEFKPHGFWSADYVRVRLSDGVVSWACGGRDEEEEPCDIVATTCFYLTLRKAIEVSLEIKNNL